MARATGLPEMLAPVAFDLAGRDDVGLADQARPKAAGLHLMAKRRGPQPELGGGFGERQHGLRFLHPNAAASPRPENSLPGIRISETAGLTWTIVRRPQPVNDSCTPVVVPLQGPGAQQ